MASKALDKRLQRLETTAEAHNHGRVFIYDPKVGIPEDVDPSYMFFIPDNGRDPKITQLTRGTHESKNI